MSEKGKVLELVAQAALPVEFDDPVLTVFEFWKALLGHERAQLGPTRRRVISSAMEIGYTVDDLRLAVVGCKVSAFHQGANETHTEYDDIELICRKEANIDKFMKLGEQKVRSMIVKDREKAQAELPESQPVPMPPEVRAKLEELFGRAKSRRKQ